MVSGVNATGAAKGAVDFHIVSLFLILKVSETLVLKYFTV